MDHKQAIRRISDIPWANVSPVAIAFVSLFAAREFADSLRVTLKTFPTSATLRAMADGEIHADNLRFGSYERRGDHADFLEYHLAEVLCNPRVVRAYATYLATVTSFRARERALTIMSREKELPDIFRRILAAHDWDACGMAFYRYYLERHIELDSSQGGHGDLMREFGQAEHVTLDTDVLGRFWTARLEFYEEALGPKGSRT